MPLLRKRSRDVFIIGEEDPPAEEEETPLGLRNESLPHHADRTASTHQLAPSPHLRRRRRRLALGSTGRGHRGPRQSQSGPTEADAEDLGATSAEPEWIAEDDDPDFDGGDHRDLTRFEAPQPEELAHEQRARKAAREAWDAPFDGPFLPVREELQPEAGDPPNGGLDHLSNRHDQGGSSDAQLMPLAGDDEIQRLRTAHGRVEAEAREARRALEEERQRAAGRDHERQRVEQRAREAEQERESSEEARQRALEAARQAEAALARASDDARRAQDEHRAEAERLRAGQTEACCLLAEVEIHQVEEERKRAEENAHRAEERRRLEEQANAAAQERERIEAELRRAEEELLREREEARQAHEDAQRTVEKAERRRAEEVESERQRYEQQALLVAQDRERLEAERTAALEDARSAREETRAAHAEGERLAEELAALRLIAEAEASSASEEGRRAEEERELLTEQTRQAGEERRAAETERERAIEKTRVAIAERDRSERTARVGQEEAERWRSEVLCLLAAEDERLAEELEAHRRGGRQQFVEAIEGDRRQLAARAEAARGGALEGAGDDARNGAEASDIESSPAPSEQDAGQSLGEALGLPHQPQQLERVDAEQEFDPVRLESPPGPRRARREARARRPKTTRLRGARTTALLALVGVTSIAVVGTGERADVAQKRTPSSAAGAPPPLAGVRPLERAPRGPQASRPRKQSSEEGSTAARSAPIGREPARASTRSPDGGATDSATSPSATVSRARSTPSSGPRFNAPVSRSASRASEGSAPRRTAPVPDGGASGGSQEGGDAGGEFSIER